MRAQFAARSGQRERFPEPGLAVSLPGALGSRSEVASDEAFLFALHESIKGAELAQMRVAGPVRKQLLEMQFRAMNKGYRSGFPAGRFDIITLNEMPIGRLITDRDQRRFHIVYIALLPRWRTKGIATFLMSRVLDEPRSRNIPCEAIVAVDNQPSARLWSRLGFVERERGLTDFVMEWRPPERSPPVQAAIGAVGRRPPPAR